MQVCEGPVADSMHCDLHGRAPSAKYHRSSATGEEMPRMKVARFYAPRDVRLEDIDEPTPAGDLRPVAMKVA